MNFFDVISKRRSVRKFTSKEVPEDVMDKALQTALLAPNSSNMQPWEFYWVKNKQKKAQLVEACLSQSAAKTASELVVIVSRTDTWRRNKELILEDLKKNNPRKSLLDYYSKIVPFAYSVGFLNSIGLFKSILLNTLSFIRPIPSVACSKARLFEQVTKTTALACENFMLAIVAQGYGCCPMEGFDERRVRKILDLPSCSSHVVMVVSVGEMDPEGIWGAQSRLPEKLFVKRIE